MLNTNFQIILINLDHKVFISFDTAQNSVSTQFHLIDLNLFYLASSVPDKIKILSLYGLIFTVLDFGYIWPRFSQNLKLCKQAYIWKRLCSFLIQPHCMVN